MKKEPPSNFRRNQRPNGPQRFVKPWVEVAVGRHPRTMEDLVCAFPAKVPTLQAMRRDGVQLETGMASCDLPLLVTTDPAIAAKYDMIPEEDYWNEQEAASE